jgi:PKD repeat protein
LFVIFGLLAAAVLLPGCHVGQKYTSEFSLIVINRATNGIEVQVNGGAVGQVASGQQGTFTLSLNETNGNVYTNGVAPTPQADVVIIAKDVKTGSLSSPKNLTLMKGTAAYQTIEASDFVPTVQTVARFTSSPTTPAVNEDVSFSAASSTVTGTGTFRWDFGDAATGTGVTIAHKFAREGSYTVTLVATSDNGLSSTASRTITISASLPPSAANFTFSPSAPAVNQDVFFNASTSGISNGTYTWDFGDGGTAAGVSVSRRFTRAGTYTVTMRVSNAVGQSGSISKPVTASNTSPTVVASFVFSPSNPSINQTVFFNASASTPASATFKWDFGDGTTATGVSPTHDYDLGGTYTVTLTVTNDVGQSSTVSRTIVVSSTSSQVTASFVFSPTAPAVNQDVYFDAAASRPTDGTFTWDYGDGATGTGLTPSHRYAQAGTYTVTLTNRSSLGQSATVSRTVTVSATSASVSASFVFSPTAPAVNQDIYFDAAASRPVDATFKWDFGDGTAVGSGVTPTHRYNLAGTYTVTLTVTNTFGQSATSSRTITVSSTSAQVTASFTFSPVNPAVNQEVFFNASASRPTDATFSWAYGDGSAADTGVAPAHRFAQAGTYTITLTVTSPLGQSSTTSRTITVTPTSPGVTASFTFSPTQPAISQLVYFNASASTPTTATYAWNYGDGTPAGAGVTPTHQFAVAGTYTVTLTVTNATNQSATTSRTVTVTTTSSGVTASFTFSPTSPATGEDVFFNASASTPTNGTFSWDFGDGSGGAGVAPSHKYLTAGTFTVTMTVTSAAGQTATTSKTVTVAAVTITADFTFSPTNPNITAGTNTVLFDPTPSSASVTTWAWDFGVLGATSTAQRPSYKFINAGTWVVRLTVGDAAGRTATITKNVTVTQ